MDNKVKRLISIVRKYFPKTTIGEVIEILDKYTNLKDSDLQIEQQVQLYKKQMQKGEK